MVLSLLLAVALAAPPAAEAVVRIQMQGNALTPDLEMLELAGLSVGMPFAPDTISAATERLERSGRFDSVRVLKRFASIADPTQIVLVVIVHEPGATIDRPGPGLPARVVRRRGAGFQYLPLVAFDEGYGWTYGVQVARAHAIGRRTRLALPLTWGGERKAAAVIESTFDGGPFTRVEGGGAITRREHPFYDAAETRQRVWLRGERTFNPSLRAGATVDWQRVSLGDTGADRVPSIGADITLDTRVNPWLARNAVWARAAWRRADLPARAANFTEIEARGYLGLPSQSVLVAHVARTGADAEVPAYAKALLGGAGTLRGFEVGTDVGDTRASGSLEIRTPLTSPLSVTKLGVNAFIDAAAVYDQGERLRAQHFSQGIGGGVWLSLAVVRLELTVTHRPGATTRVQFGMNSGF